MSGVSRVGQDTAGGLITGDLAPTVKVNNKPVAVKGAEIAAHGPGQHTAAVMVGASASVKANNILVCRQGDAASCGDVASGSSDVNIGS